MMEKETISDYRKVRQELEYLGVEYKTFQLKENRPFRVIAATAKYQFKRYTPQIIPMEMPMQRLQLLLKISSSTTSFNP
uniref:Uncharacterized protein n=1 Tax=Vespula pensylvanica TaxID=30213 RepID=A0A834JG07_VESPE|nr:hypothetical protein H0235_018468 [Vespula pensylvanica]